MIIHTLGPKTTDAYLATLAYCQQQRLVADIQLHDSFEVIIDNLASYKGDALLIPAAFKSHKIEDLDWAKLNYNMSDRLSIKDTFHLPLMPMVLVENTNYQVDKAIIHAATEGLLDDFMTVKNPTFDLTRQVIYADSKAVALTDFFTEGYHYAIVSKDHYEEIAQHKFGYTIKKEYDTSMVWVVYNIF